MSPHLQESLLEAATATFEGLAFSFPFPDGEDPSPAAHAADASASVEFDGPRSGVLVLRLGGGALPVLAANMLGEDTPPAEPLQHDALKELANVVCGNTVPVLASKCDIFRLGPPRIQRADIDEIVVRELPTPSARVRLAVEDGWAEVLLFFRDSPSS